MTGKNTILITGSSGKLGQAMARHFAAVKCELCLHGSKAGSKHLKCDFLNTKSVSGFMDRAFRLFPGINILINNAAVHEKSCFRECSDSSLRKHFDVNFFAPFILTREFARRAGTGLVINMLDYRITKNRSQYFAYTLSKKILAEFTIMCAAELGPQIRVNAVAPGMIIPSSPEEKKLFAECSAKTGDARQVLNALDFFIDNKTITGQILFVDGGLSL